MPCHRVRGRNANSECPLSGRELVRSVLGPSSGNLATSSRFTGSNRVYVLSREAISRYRKNHPSPDDATPNLETLVPKEDLGKFTGEDFLPVKDTYLTIGDASATAQISSLLTSRRHPYDLRFGSDLSFGDLRRVRRF